MFEYAATALFGIVILGILLYATMSPEAEDPGDIKRRDTNK